MVIKLNFCSVGEKEDADKQEMLDWWECRIVKPLCKSVWLFLIPLDIHLLYYPAIPLIGIYLRKIKCSFTRKLVTNEYNDFACAPNWKQPNVHQFMNE